MDGQLITVTPGALQLPVANSGSAAAGPEGALVELNGSGSHTEPPGRSLLYRWTFLSVPRGSALTSGALRPNDSHRRTRRCPDRCFDGLCCRCTTCSVGVKAQRYALETEPRKPLE